MNHQAKKRMKALARENADELDSTICHNVVYEAVQGQHSHDDDLCAVLEIAENAYALADRREGIDRDDDLRWAAFDAAETLNDQVDSVVDEVIAMALGELLEDLSNDDWTDAWSQEEIDTAKHEAREWLQTHTEVAERVGVLEEVDA